MTNRLLAVLVCFALSQAGNAESRVQMLEALIYHPQRMAPATVVSLNEATVSAQLEARVAALPVLVGDRVAEGQTLVKLDCADYQINQRVAEAGLDSAAARLKLAENRLARARQLFRQQLTSQEDVDARDADRDALAADLEVREAERDRARLAVSRCDVKAPFEGLVAERLAAKGQLASIGTPLIALIDPRNIELSAQISVADAAQLSDVGTLNFTSGQSWPVKVRELLNAVNPETRNREVRLVFTGPLPLPGVAGKLEWRDPRPFVPARFIVKRDGDFGLFLAANGKARFLALPGAQPGRDQPVELPLDTLVVAEGLATLRDGDELSAESANVSYKER